MNKELKNQLKLREQVIAYLVGKDRLAHEAVLSVNSKQYSESPIADVDGEQLICQLYDLKSIGYIEIKKQYYDEDSGAFNYRVTLLEPILNYAINKHDESVANRRKWIQFWIPVILSVVAIMVSVASLSLELGWITPEPTRTEQVVSTNAPRTTGDSYTTEPHNPAQSNSQ